MSRVKTTSIVAWLTAIVLVATSAWAIGPMNKKTYFTFSGPVALPGVTLPAGTYTFRLADSTANRHIVQVLDRDERHIYRTLLAVAAERPEATGDPVVMFREAPAKMPPPVRYWYYAGERTGNEFVYSKEQAQRIANASGESVMATESTSTSGAEMETAEMSRVEPERREQPARAQAQPEPQSKPTPSETYSPESRREATMGRSEPRQLPQTASELPLAGLIGLLALGGALSARALRKSIV